jgi:soluble lytic murein transglycosylase-like protein
MKKLATAALCLFVGACNTTPTETSFANDNFAEIIQNKARINSLPENLIYNVIRIESRFRPNVTGTSGEVGLMQIKLATARSVGFTGTRRELYQPEINIRYGSRYLAQAYAKANGDSCIAAMYYNQGLHSRRFSNSARKYCKLVTN